MNNKNPLIPVFFANGFEEIEAITVVDVLRRAGYEVPLVSVSNELNITGAHGIQLIADKLFADINFNLANMLVLPGGMPGASNLNGHKGLAKVIQTHHASGKPIAAICAAPMILGDLGLLAGHTATCYPGFEKYLVGAKVTSNPVEVSGSFITAKGIGAALQFALAIIRYFEPGNKAGELAKQMVIE